jgi:hypothetical protein
VILFGLLVQAARLACSLSGRRSTFYLAMLLTGVGLATAGFLSITTAVVPWFVRRRSTALALMSIGLSLGGLLVPLVAARWWTSAGARRCSSRPRVLLAGLPLAVLMRRSPAPYGQLPDGGYGLRGPAPRRDALRPGPSAPITRCARRCGRARSGSSASGTRGAARGVGRDGAPGAARVRGRGFSLQRAAGAVALVTLTSAGQVIGGPLGDRFDKRLHRDRGDAAHGGAAGAGMGPWLVAVVTFAVVARRRLGRARAADGVAARRLLRREPLRLDHGRVDDGVHGRQLVGPGPGWHARRRAGRLPPRLHVLAGARGRRLAELLVRVAAADRRGTRRRPRAAAGIDSTRTSRLAMSDVALGIDIGGSGIKAALVDVANGALVAERQRLPTPQPRRPPAVADDGRRGV